MLELSQSIGHVGEFSPPETARSGPDDMRLWYARPARDWMTEALPIGNGFLGAMVFGGVRVERIQFNEESLWSGGPGQNPGYSGGLRKGAHKALPEVRRLLGQGRKQEAHEHLRTELTGSVAFADAPSHPHDYGDFGAFQPFGDLVIRQPCEAAPCGYRRVLDLESGVLDIAYRSGDISHRRRYFANYPSRVLVFRFENDAPNGQSYFVRLLSSHSLETVREHEWLILRGELDSNRMRMEAVLSARIEGGEMRFDCEGIRIAGASALTLILTAATDYLPRWPSYRGNDFERQNRRVMSGAVEKSYPALLEEHLRDYRPLFGGTSLRLGSAADKSNAGAPPTDCRLAAYRRGGQDPALEALFFAYGRYLLISASRPGALPANLQGIWNDRRFPPWACDYHFNINTQMIYWPAEVVGLSETHLPLLDHIGNLVQPGTETAAEFFGARGWVVNTMNNIFGYTAPGWDVPWGFFPAAAAWLCKHLWEHFRYTVDLEYLRCQALPVMQGAVVFWLDYLVRDKDGLLVAAPGYSPEHGDIAAGASMDQQIVWDLFTNYLHACSALNLSHSLAQRVAQARDGLAPPRIGAWGQLQEWREDIDGPCDRHRHLSHLFALFPGRQIDPDRTPELAKAAATALAARGDEGTAWSLAWKINLWARLKDGNRAYRLLRRLLRLSVHPSLAECKGVIDSEDRYDHSGVHANLLATHPPFQLDANMGAVAGMAEMLLQSDAGSIELLPALPETWQEGKVTGLRAPGGFAVDMAWSGGELIEVKVAKVSRVVGGGEFELRYRGRRCSFTDRHPLELRLNGELVPRPPAHIT